MEFHMFNRRKVPVQGLVQPWVRDLMDVAAARGDYASLSEIIRDSLNTWAQDYQDRQAKHRAFLAAAYQRTKQ